MRHSVTGIVQSILPKKQKWLYSCQIQLNRNISLSLPPSSHQITGLHLGFQTQPCNPNKFNTGWANDKRIFLWVSLNKWNYMYESREKIVLNCSEIWKRRALDLEHELSYRLMEFTIQDVITCSFQATVIVWLNTLSIYRTSSILQATMHRKGS